ncbi:MAG TPA: hypothetical protein VGE06_06960, partial [Flavisolibacter sp.]
CQKAKGERKELINISQGRKQFPVYRSKFTVSFVFIHVSGKKPFQWNIDRSSFSPHLRAKNKKIPPPAGF